MIYPEIFNWVLKNFHKNPKDKVNCLMCTTYSTIRNTKPYPVHIWGILAIFQFSSKANTRFRVFYINFSLFLLFMAININDTGFYCIFLDSLTLGTTWNTVSEPKSYWKDKILQGQWNAGIIRKFSFWSIRKFLNEYRKNSSKIPRIRPIALCAQPIQLLETISLTLRIFEEFL